MRKPVRQPDGVDLAVTIVGWLIVMGFLVLRAILANGGAP